MGPRTLTNVDGSSTTVNPRELAGSGYKGQRHHKHFRPRSYAGNHGAAASEPEPLAHQRSLSVHASSSTGKVTLPSIKHPSQSATAASSSSRTAALNSSILGRAPPEYPLTCGRRHRLRRRRIWHSRASRIDFSCTRQQSSIVIGSSLSLSLSSIGFSLCFFIISLSLCLSLSVVVSVLCLAVYFAAPSRPPCRPPLLSRRAHREIYIFLKNAIKFWFP